MRNINKRNIALFFMLFIFPRLGFADVTFKDVSIYIMKYGYAITSKTITKPLVLKKYISNTGVEKYYADQSVIELIERFDGPKKTLYSTIKFTVGHCDLTREVIGNLTKYKAPGFPVKINQTFTDGSSRDIVIPNVDFLSQKSSSVSYYGNYVFSIPAYGDWPELFYIFQLYGSGSMDGAAVPVVPVVSPTPTSTPIAK